MPYKPVPGAKGVKYRPASETMADPNFDVYQDAQGNWHAREKPGWLMKSLPYIIGGTMGYGALAGAGVLPSIAGGGGAAASGSGAAAGGVLPSSQLAMSPLYTGPVVGGSQGVSAGLGAAGAAAGAGADYLGDKPGVVSRVAKAVGGDGGANQWVKAALAALAGVPALVAAKNSGPTAEELAMQQQIKDMLASQQRRVTFQDPLHEAVTRLAMSRLPTASQRPLAEHM